MATASLMAGIMAIGRRSCLTACCPSAAAAAAATHTHAQTAVVLTPGSYYFDALDQLPEDSGLQARIDAWVQMHGSSSKQVANPRPVLSLATKKSAVAFKVPRSVAPSTLGRTLCGWSVGKGATGMLGSWAKRH
jgi:hypothetical protein